MELDPCIPTSKAGGTGRLQISNRMARWIHSSLRRHQQCNSLMSYAAMEQTAFQLPSVVRHARLQCQNICR